MTTWRYRLDTPFELIAPELLGIEFQNEWITIRHGRLRIERDYAWDGCSPAWRLPGGIWLGVPDGPLGTDGRPVSWQATLVHDAICQFRPDIEGLAKVATVRLFQRLLATASAPQWMVWLYPAAVDALGPQAWAGRTSTTSKGEATNG